MMVMDESIRILTEESGTVPLLGSREGDRTDMERTAGPGTEGETT
mgnify:FL=1